MSSSSKTAHSGTIESPVQLLQIILYGITRTEENSSEVITLLNLHDDPPTGDSSADLSVEIRFKRLRTSSQVVYLSALPHLLAHYYKREATQIATDIMNLLCTYLTGYGNTFVYPDLPREAVQNLVVGVLPSGLLAFELRDGAIAYWLNRLLHHSFTQAPSSNLSPASNFSTQLFTVQHAHARCCSLLRLAHREGLIRLNQPDAEPSQWTFTVPPAISWLNASSQLQASTPAERDLISWLLLALDAIAEPAWLSPQKILSLAEAGSRSFQTMHQTCQLFGDFRTQPSDRIHAHLALVLATQRILSQLLQRLDALAPHEL